MAMTASRPQFTEHILNMLWSIWGELGMSSWTRRHAEWGIDPEPLIIFTSVFARSDRRLHDESLDWCIRYHRYLSISRLNNLLKVAVPEVQDAFASYAATVNAHAPVHWPTNVSAEPFQPTNRSHVSTFTAPSLVALRLRALVGVGARAEVLRHYALSLDASFTAADFTEAHYSKRVLAQELESLRQGGLLDSLPRGNQRSYRLVDPVAFSAFCGATPAIFPNWWSVLSLLFDLDRLVAESDDREPVVLATEAKRLLRERKSEVASIDGTPRVPGHILGERFWGEFVGWANATVTALASGSVPSRVGTPVESALRTESSESRGQVLVGLYGFSYPEWEGLIYPRGLPTQERLGHYAKHFPVVELSSTYYGIPKESDVRRWSEQTPPTFVMTAKVPRQITQEAHLEGKTALQAMEDFITRMRLLGSRLGPLVFQMSPSFRYPSGFRALAAMLSGIPTLGGEGLRFAVEFRDRSWLHAGEAADLLRECGVAWVWNDWEPEGGATRPLPRPIDDRRVWRVTADAFAYVRLTGRHTDMTSHRTPPIDRVEELDRWASLINEFVAGREDRTVFALVSDHYAGGGPSSARELQHALGLPVPDLVPVDDRRPMLL